MKAIYLKSALIAVLLMAIGCLYALYANDDDNNCAEFERMTKALEKDSVNEKLHQKLWNAYVIDSVEKVTLPFFTEWQKASDKISAQYMNPVVDSLFQRAFDYSYNGNEPYIVIPIDIPICTYKSDYNKDDIYNHFDESTLVSVRYYVPHLKKEKPVIYLFNSVYKRLAGYLGGVKDDTGRDIDREHVLELRKYIEVYYGHWGGYWLLMSMPIILEIDVFENGVTVDFRDTYNSGATLFMPNNSEKIIVTREWIE